MTFEVEDVAGQELTVDVMIRLDTVELFCLSRNRAVFDRDMMRSWLREPAGDLTMDDITWSCVDERVGLTIDPLVPWWPVPWLVLLELTGRI